MPSPDTTPLALETVTTSITQRRWLGLSPLVSGLIAALVLIITSGAVLFNFHYSLCRQADASMRDALQRTAAAGALVVDAENHHRFLSADEESSPDYQLEIARLAAVKQNMAGAGSFKYIYTCILRDGKVYFVLDPTPAGDRDGDGLDDKSHIMQEYPDPSAALRQTLLTGQPGIEPVPRRDQWGTFLSAYAPIRDRAGKTVAALGVDMELSAYQEKISGITRTSLQSGLGTFSLAILAAIAVQSYQKRLQRTLRTMSKAAQAAQAADRAKSRFLATMSHEIRTPMNGVIGMTELLRTTPLSTVQRDYVDTIHTSGENLLTIINDILDFSKIEAGSLTLESMPVNVEALLRETVKLFHPAAADKELKLTATLQEGTPARFKSDATRLRQILVNIVSNAVKFTHYGSVTLQAAPGTLPDGQPGIRFSITDTGIGISPEQRERLFRPFSQGDSSTTREFGGTGLGLVISDRLCRAMGGEILVDSTPGLGSVFHFTLPAEVVSGAGHTGPVPIRHATNQRQPSPAPNPAPALAMALAVAPAPEPAAASPPCPNAARPSRTLVISPDRLLRSLLVRLLEKSGHSVQGAQSAAASDPYLAETLAWDVVIVDLALAPDRPVEIATTFAAQMPSTTRTAVINSGLGKEDLANLAAAGIPVLQRHPKLADLAVLAGR